MNEIWMERMKGKDAGRKENIRMREILKEDERDMKKEDVEMEGYEEDSYFRYYGLTVLSG